MEEEEGLEGDACVRARVLKEGGKAQAAAAAAAAAAQGG